MITYELGTITVEEPIVSCENCPFHETMEYNYDLEGLPQDCEHYCALTKDSICETGTWFSHGKSEYDGSDALQKRLDSCPLKEKGS